MLELGRRARDSEVDVVYLLNLALTLARICIADSELDEARLALQQAAEYVERLRLFADDDCQTDLPGARKRLEAEYLTMRMALVRCLAWPG